MRLRWALLPLAVGLALGCGKPQPTLEEVVPNQAYSNGDVRLSLRGYDFVPATIVDPLSGNRIATSDGFEARMGRDDRWVKLTGLVWLSASELAVTLPGESARSLPTGALDAEVTDPRGQVTRLSAAFRELGLDSEGPHLDFRIPSARFAPGMLLRGTIHATEPAPGHVGSLSWALYENGSKREPSDDQSSVPCHAADGTTAADCSFLHEISSTLQEGDVVRIEAKSADAFRNRSERSLTITLEARPTLHSIGPKQGGLAGGTDVVIRGQGFVAGSTVTIGGEPLFPGGGIRVDDTMISGYVPAARAAGDAAVIVHTVLGDTAEPILFTYKRPPTIVAITPSSGDPDGGTAVAIDGSGFGIDTRIYFGPTLGEGVPLNETSRHEDGTLILGWAPAGRGTTTVWAFDGALGFSALPNGFTWRAP